MKKLWIFLIFLFLEPSSLVTAEDLTGLDSQTPLIRKPSPRFQPIPTYQHQNRPAFKLNTAKKKTGSEKPKGQFFPLTPLPTVPVTKVILKDKQGKPVTLFPNLKAKNYSTIFQDQHP